MARFCLCCMALQSVNVCGSPFSILQKCTVTISPLFKVMEEGANKAAASPAIDESKFTNKVAITILKGASTQGNPSYDPDTSKASTDALVI